MVARKNLSVTLYVHSLSYSHYSSQSHGKSFKAKGQIAPVRAMKTHTGAAEVYYQSSLTAAFSDFEWLTSHLSRFNLREVPQLIRRLSGSQSQSRRSAQEIHFSPKLGIEPLIVQPLAITLSGL